MGADKTTAIPANVQSRFFTPAWALSRFELFGSALHGVGGTMTATDGDLQNDVVIGLGSAIRAIAWDLEDLCEKIRGGDAEGGAR